MHQLDVELYKVLHQFEHFRGVVGIELLHRFEVLVKSFLRPLVGQEALQSLVDEPWLDLVVHHLIGLHGLCLGHRLFGLLLTESLRHLCFL